MDRYILYMEFAEDRRKPGNRIRVFAGRTDSEDQALDWAYAILKDEGGDVEAVEIMNWYGPDEGFLYRIGRGDAGDSQLAS
jgi:hypothetical protein